MPSLSYPIGPLGVGVLDFEDIDLGDFLFLNWFFGVSNGSLIESSISESLSLMSFNLCLDTGGMELLSLEVSEASSDEMLLLESPIVRISCSIILFVVITVGAVFFS